MRSTSLILVADDTEDIRELYAAYLAIFGYEVVLAADGQEALDVARERHPNVVVMDLAMPVLDGWEATRRIKADALTRDICVLVVTGNVLRDQLEAARQAGADAVMTKPCHPDDVKLAIEHALRGEPIPARICVR